MALAAMFFTIAVACSGNEDQGSAPTLVIGGIPDQDVSLLEERFGGIANYLSEAVGIDVEYQPAISYAALVTAFQNGDVKLGWFGGLTGVQTRIATLGAEALLQRPRDAAFHSVIIVGSGLDASFLADLAGHTFTFGSENSTSGHLVPRWFLTQAGIDPESDFLGPPSYSSSHDTTWKLVESGSFDAGALSAAVWDRAVREGTVDTSKVRVLERVGPYFDYHWVAHPEIDATYGDGTTEKIRAALMNLDLAVPEQKRLLELFDTDRFIKTENGNYQAIEEMAQSLGLVN
jgi:phosphonate transport system substrate-binding protein